MTQRPYDIVVFGATGFTGGLVARYLAKRLGTTRWALAGRSADKLGKLRRELEREDPRMAEVGLIQASSDDPASLRAMAESAGAIINLVGPYQAQGEALIEACIERTCDYFDLTGEGRWWSGVVERHHESARKAGVIVVPSCGFESVPHDLGVLFTLDQLPGDQPVTIDAYVRAKGRASGGTWASILAELSSGARPSKPSGGSGGRNRLERVQLPNHKTGAPSEQWAVPAPTIEPRVVARTAKLITELPELRYREYIAFRSRKEVAALGLGVAGAFVLARFGPTRRWLQGLRPQGSGPAPEVRARSWFRIDFVGRGGGREVRTHVSGGDPGYDETAKFISEAAITAIEDRERLPLRGVLTPASGLGRNLTQRLQAAGIEFAVDDLSGGSGSASGR